MGLSFQLDFSHKQMILGGYDGELKIRAGALENLRPTICLKTYELIQEKKSFDILQDL